ncbi:hypothetical protein [Phenylobacterium sp.]|uniref:hypothetical protein n=1 Tax=Phenylobacterium sp. TaxID=1871053 RepID=UPI002C9FA03B|nr:hypothetical protein [Phenylobacterium sp.]HLZ76761.1 hypothetical protein [Phenylobacterium sp.]
MPFPEIDALARAAAGDVLSPTDPQIAALFNALGVAADQRASAARQALQRWAEDRRAPQAERDHAVSRLAELAAG